jgi:hypothetical protein
LADQRYIYRARLAADGTAGDTVKRKSTDDLADRAGSFVVERLETKPPRKRLTPIVKMFTGKKAPR